MTMAMVPHCSYLISPPNPSGFSPCPWPQLFPKRFHLGGQYAIPGLSKIRWILPKESPIHRLFNEIHVFKFGATFLHLSRPVPQKDLHKSICQSGMMETEAGCPNFINVTGRIRFGFPATTLLLTNSLLLAMPSEALAETCEADNSFFSMPLLLLVALIGATVGGLLARERRGELQRLNEQLRQINAALRRQAKVESYAPSLSYAPVPVGGRILETQVIVDPKKQELVSHLKTGKKYLRNQELEKALMEFKEALDLARDLNDPTKEKKAARGLGASLQRQGKYREAIKYHSIVLSISERVGESAGDTEAYGAIADCYTDLGDLENAATFYDKYIARLEAD